MDYLKTGNTKMKWFVTIVSSLLIIISTVARIIQKLEADKILCTVFIIVVGLIWGANFINYFKK
jgi:hypothetical protein